MKNDKDDLRYERKFVIKGHLFESIVSQIMLHPFLFKEIFYERTINNIYLDTPSFASYTENINGDTYREKIRVRWYGNLDGHVSKPKLEYKNKVSNLNFKKTYNLVDFNFKAPFTDENLQNIFRASDLPKHELSRLSTLKMSLINRYTRRYYFSNSQNVRITIDRNLQYFVPYTHQFWPYSINQDLIVEVKYEKNSDVNLASLLNGLPYLQIKNSKYVNGVNFFYS